MKIISIVGTRPQFLKLIPLIQEFKNYSFIQHIVIHSGQHYDDNMSKSIFTTLEIPMPNYILTRSGSTLSQNLGNMIINIDNIITQENPNIIIVFGDCDTTTAGSLVAIKNKIFLVHIEAGMRSYNKKMPEELNRLITDNISDLLLCSTREAIKNIQNENINAQYSYVGNLQIDLLKFCCKKYLNKDILNKNKLIENNFILLTIHRAYNTNKASLKLIFNQLKEIKSDIIFPIHPRTKTIIEKDNIPVPANIKVIPPVNYLNMTILERFCKLIITDSGGIQPEAGFFKKKCIVMRSETEWLSEINNNNNILYDYQTPLPIFIENFISIPVKNTNNSYSVCASRNIINTILTNYK